MTRDPTVSSGTNSYSQYQNGEHNSNAPAGHIDQKDWEKSLATNARAAYGGEAQSPMIARLLEDLLSTDLRAPGFPARLE